MDIDEFLEIEKLTLSEYAAFSDAPWINKRKEEENDQSETEYRLAFQRDRDRIIHSRAFRRLMHKTQVFNANKGDHYRNRLTHTLEVSQIARSIGKSLRLNDELIEAISLGHDLGHTPFGHVGERTLHLLISGKYSDIEDGMNKNNCGGFKHNFQSIQIVDNIEKRTNRYTGLNLTLAVREGILKHTGNKIRIPKVLASRNLNKSDKEEIKYNTLKLLNMNINNPSMTLEGQIVSIADEIAQCTHDLEDGIRSKILDKQTLGDNRLIQVICEKEGIKLEDLKETVDIRNTLIKSLVAYLIFNVCTTTKENLKKVTNPPKFQDKDDIYKETYVCFDEDVQVLHKELSNLITDNVIASQSVTQTDLKAELIIKRLFKGYYNHPQQLPDYILERYYSSNDKVFSRIEIENQKELLQDDAEFIRLICDHIGCMTDQYASREYKKLFEPEYY